MHTWYKFASYTPGIGLCRDRFKGGTRDVEHRNGACILRRPEEVENERWRSTGNVKQLGTAGWYKVRTPQYLDTEYVTILNSPPALCSMNGITKRRSSYHTMVVQINTTKPNSMLFFILIILTQISESHILSRNQFSDVNLFIYFLQFSTLHSKSNFI